MAFHQRNAANPPKLVAPLFPDHGLESLHLNACEVDVAMDAIAQLIPHLDIDDCHKVVELAEAQATLLDIMDVRQQRLNVRDGASTLGGRAA